MNVPSNQTQISEVILLGFHVDPSLELLLFGFFLLFYGLTLMGNGLILGLICLDSRLHSPMYFFLSHLALVDMSYASSTVPKMLANLVMHRKTISFAPCLLQTFLYLALAVTECMTLVVMSYDRYVAICHALHHTVLMSWRVCVALAAASWSFGSALSAVHAALLLRLPFCGPREANHLLCEILAVLKLACADTRLNQAVVLAACAFVLVGPLCCALVSYANSLWATLKIQSEQARAKAFSTCSSHRCVVGLFFGIAVLLYMVPDSAQREEQEKILSLFHSLFNPALNPVIYSPRSAQAQGAFLRALRRRRSGGAGA